MPARSPLEVRGDWGRYYVTKARRCNLAARVLEPESGGVGEVVGDVRVTRCYKSVTDSPRFATIEHDPSRELWCPKVFIHGACSFWLVIAFNSYEWGLIVHSSGPDCRVASRNFVTGCLTKHVTHSPSVMRRKTRFASGCRPQQ